MPPYGAQIVPAAWANKQQKVVTNVISIREDKAAMEKAQELLETFLQKVGDMEPGCELFLLNRDDERYQFVTYKDAEAVKIHLGSAHMKKLIQGEDEHNVKRGGNDVHHETLIAQIGPRQL